MALPEFPEDIHELTLLYVLTPISDGMRDLYHQELARRIAIYAPPEHRLAERGKYLRRAQATAKLVTGS